MWFIVANNGSPNRVIRATRGSPLLVISCLPLRGDNTIHSQEDDVEIHGMVTISHHPLFEVPVSAGVPSNALMPEDIQAQSCPTSQPSQPAASVDSGSVSYCDSIRSFIQNQTFSISLRPGLCGGQLISGIPIRFRAVVVELSAREGRLEGPDLRQPSWVAEGQPCVLSDAIGSEMAANPKNTMLSITLHTCLDTDLTSRRTSRPTLFGTSPVKILYPQLLVAALFDSVGSEPGCDGLKSHVPKCDLLEI